MPDLIPVKHLRTYAGVYPTAWRQADDLRARRGHDVDWPDWCYLPLAGAYAIIETEATRQGIPMITAVSDVGNLGALIAWRQTQGVYRFDATVFDAVWNTPLSGDLPADVLYRMPEWCVWVETPIDDGLHSPGFFAYLEHDYNTGRAELRLTISNGEQIFTQPIHLTGRTLADCIEAAIIEGGHQAAKIGQGIDLKGMTGMMAEALRPVIVPRVSLLLYLCAVNSEIRDERTGFKRPANPAPIRTRAGLKTFAAATPTRWDVAVRVGAAIRSVTNREPGEDRGGTRAGPRPHIRRAHWHTFLHGPGRTERALKWLPPMPINLDDSELPAVLRDVK